MSVKTLPLILCFILFQNLNAQDTYIHTFGSPLSQEFAMNQYNLDPEATGVVLYERGNYTVDDSDGYIRLIKNVHRKMKVFDAKNFDYATIEIPYYRETNISENVTQIKAITHNGKAQKYVSADAIYDTDENPYWSMKKFTFPDVQDGSILEYTYQIETPYFSNLGSWFFMNSLPTIYSELHTEIPGNFSYNRILFGDRELDVNHAEIKKSCFHLPGFKVPGDCESATYGMKNIPAFKQEEYMLSRNNYMPSIKFELKKIIDLDEGRRLYTTTWKEVDQRLRTNKDLGRQLKYASYFEENLPASILSISDELARAKAVYYYIQENMTWNKQRRILSGIRVKQAFENKSGNSSEINLALINALEAAKIDAKIMLISTRDRAMPSKEYPVLTDFNYAIVYVPIKGTKYFLDATDKHTSFGVLPIRDLNGEGRVLDFKKGSYWETITSTSRNMHYINMQISADESGFFSGKIDEVSTGYIAAQKRRNNNEYPLHEIIKRKQSTNEGVNISNLSIENDKDFEKPYKEIYNIDGVGQTAVSELYIYPFPNTYFNRNPFLQKSRKYPIEFGFPIINNYLISIDVKDQYEIIKVPENRLVQLPENDGELSVVYDVVGSKINIRLSLRLNTYSYAPDAYQSLQVFFNELIKIQSKEPIGLKKI